MKTKWIIAIVTVIIICFGGIIIYMSLQTKSFKAVISHIGNDYIVVEVSNNEKYNGSYSISIDEETEIEDDLGNAILISELSEGDNIIVFFSGGIQESDPALISNCKKVIVSTD